MVSLFKFSAFIALASSVLSIPLEQRDDSVPGVLKFDIEPRQLDGPLHSKRQIKDYFKRDTTYLNETVDFTINTYYVIDTFIGSEHTKVPVVLDTGSSDLIVPPSDADVPGTGWFDPSNSTTIKQILPSDYSFGRLTNYYQDTVGVGGDVYLKDFKFGITAETTQYQIPLLGVGPGSYITTIVTQLKHQGFINSTSFSLFLNSPDAASGQIIFGGIDHEKYEGDLVPHWIQGDFSVSSNGIFFEDGTNGTFQSTAILDSGSSNSVFSTSFVKAINKVFQPYSNGTVDFKEEWRTQNFTLAFDSQLLEFPYLDLLTTNDNDQWELFPFQESDVETILGVRFLRRLYIAADYDTNFISLAQAKYTDKSNITAN